MLALLHEVAVEQDVILIQESSSNNYGKYVYNDKSKMPAQEKKHYDILKKQSSDVVHYWLQFCLNWPRLTEDLQNLSKIMSVPDIGDTPPLLYFRDTYSNL